MVHSYRPSWPVIERSKTQCWPNHVNGYRGSPLLFSPCSTHLDGFLVLLDLVVECPPPRRLGIELEMTGNLVQLVIHLQMERKRIGLEVIHYSNSMWLEKIYLKLIVLNKFILSYDHLNTCVITASISPTRETAFCTLLFISSTQMST